MTAAWDQVVDVLKEAILAYGYVFNGNLGAGILAVTFLARLALMPVTLRLARMTAAHQRMMQKLQPELDAVKARYANDARRMNEEIQKVLSREGVSLVPVAGCLGTIAQAPALMALYSAVRRVALMGGKFAWIRDISKPSLALTVIVGAVTAIGAMTGGDTSAQNRTLLLVLPTIVTIIVLSKMAAGVALYWGMSSAFGVAQGMLAKRQTV
jgi:YidC/Oxa1 family membrane protein insertase